MPIHQVFSQPIPRSNSPTNVHSKRCRSRSSSPISNSQHRRMLIRNRVPLRERAKVSLTVFTKANPPPYESMLRFGLNAQLEKRFAKTPVNDDQEESEEKEVEDQQEEEPVQDSSHSSSESTKDEDEADTSSDVVALPDDTDRKPAVSVQSQPRVLGYLNGRLARGVKRDRESDEDDGSDAEDEEETHNQHSLLEELTLHLNPVSPPSQVDDVTSRPMKRLRTRQTPGNAYAVPAVFEDENTERRGRSRSIRGERKSTFVEDEDEYDELQTILPYLYLADAGSEQHLAAINGKYKVEGGRLPITHIVELVSDPVEDEESSSVSSHPSKRKLWDWWYDSSASVHRLVLRLPSASYEDISSKCKLHLSRTQLVMVRDLLSLAFDYEVHPESPTWNVAPAQYWDGLRGEELSRVMLVCERGEGKEREAVAAATCFTAYSSQQSIDEILTAVMDGDDHQIEEEYREGARSLWEDWRAISRLVEASAYGVNEYQ